MSVRRFAVLIGNSKFPNEPRLPPLNCPETDVDDLAEVLSSEELGRFTSIVPLKNFTHYEVLREVGNVFDQSGKDDLILIYYSGHGKQDWEGQLYLATANTRTLTPNALTSSSVPIESIQRFIKHSKAQTTVLILDCCYSGAVEGAFVRGGTEEQLQKVSKTRGTYIITASTGVQSAIEKEGDRNGLLTKHLIRGIRDGLAEQDEDGWINIDALFEFVYGAVTSEGAQEPMHWNFNVQGTKLKIARAGRNEQIQERIETLSQEGQNAQAKGDWETAIQIFTQVKEMAPNHQAAVWLSQVREQQKLDNWYKDGQKYLNEGQWKESLESFQRITAGDTKYKDTIELIEYAERELRTEAIASGLSEAEQSIAEEDWDSAIKNLTEILSLDSDNVQVRAKLVESQKQKELLDLYGAGLEHQEARHWNQARAYFKQIREKAGEYKDVTNLLREIEHNEAEEEERQRAHERATAELADRKLDEAQKAITEQNWEIAAQSLNEVNALISKGSYLNDKLTEVNLALMHSQQQQATDALYTSGLEHYTARRWSKAWMYFELVRENAGEYKDVTTLIKRSNINLIRGYLLKWYSGCVFVSLSFLIFTLSLTWWRYFALLGISNFAPIFSGVILVVSLYTIFRLSNDSGNPLRDMSRLRLEYQAKKGSMAKISDDTLTLNSSDHENWQSAAEEKLSQRLSTLIRVDETLHIDPNFITCAEYQLFINERRMRNEYYQPDHWVEPFFLPGTGDQAVSGVKPRDAMRFCAWLTERNRNQVTYRLPTSKEAVKFPSNKVDIATWCSKGSNFHLVGLSAIHKRTIRKELAKWIKPGLPMPLSLYKYLIPKRNIRRGLNSIGRALACLELACDPTEVVYDFHTAVELKLSPTHALVSLENLARTMDLQGTRVWTPNIGTFTPSTQALQSNDLAKLRNLAESMKKTSRPVASSIAGLVIALLDIVTARTIIEKRQAQRVYAVQILSCAYLGYRYLIRGLARRNSRSRLTRWLNPDKRLEDERKTVETDRIRVAEDYWYWQMVMAREANELPSWEGIRIVREKNIKH